MPFGQKPGAGGAVIDFDAVYRDLIKRRSMRPASRCAPTRSRRALHRPMFERLILCDFAAADLTTANAHMFYELGVRHAVKP